MVAVTVFPVSMLNSHRRLSFWKSYQISGKKNVRHPEVYAILFHKKLNGGNTLKN